jgi:hypothetical protein
LDDRALVDKPMIFRLSQKLAKKLKEGTLPSLPPDENRYADWSAHLFTADRTQYIILTNTKSLYSVVMYGRGSTDGGLFIDRALNCIREFMEDDGQAFVYQRFIAPASEKVRFGRALSQSFIGSMNNLVYHAKMWLTEGGLSPHDTGFHLNAIPMAPLGYQNPREAFRKLAGGL